MKVAFIVDKCSPFFTGGYENRVQNIATRLSSKHEVRVYTSLVGDREVLAGVTFLRSSLPTTRGAKPFNRSLLHSVAFALGLVKSPFDGWVPDVVIVEAIPFVHLPVIGRWIHDTDSLVVLNVNEAWSEYPYFRGLLALPSRVTVRYLLRRGLDFSDMVITISRTTAESLKSNYGFEGASVVPMGVDMSRLILTPLTDLGTRQYDFIMLGRVVSVKRHIDLLRALARLKSGGKWDGQAAIVGDGPHLLQLKQYSRDTGLSANITFFGQVSEEDKFRLLRDARVFVLCSEREGFSLATLEAQVSGTAVVAARPAGRDVFGVSDLVEDGVTGLLYPTGDIEQLSRSLLRLNRDTSLRMMMAENGVRQAARYDWNRIVTEFEKQLTARLKA